MALPRNFTAGERLFASDLNDNFEHLEDFVEDAGTLLVPSTTDTGAPWSIPYISGGASGTLAALSEDVADAVAAGLSSPLEVVTFTSSGTFDLASYSKARALLVTCVGGGGGSGGASQTTGETNHTSVGGHGGGAATAITYIDDLTILTSPVTVTVGAGGAGGAAGNNAGSNGGTTSFGSVCSADGGVGGEGRPTTSGTAANYPRIGTAGQATGTGDLVLPGYPAENTQANAVDGMVTRPGSSALFPSTMQSRKVGEAISVPVAAAVAAPAHSYGSGARGPSIGRSQTGNQAGAAGADGIVIVEVY